jgi:tyrosyl-tRNA synthetase
MEVPDHLIIRYYELATDEHPDTVDAIKAKLEAGENPRNLKYDLAKTITSLYHSAEETEKAMAYYDAAFSKKAIPDDIPEVELGDSKTVFDVADKVIAMGVIKSKGDYRRLIQQGGAQLNGEKLSANDLSKELVAGDVLKLGKKNFVKFI